MQFPKKKVILVTGSNGQLGKELRHLSLLQDTFEFLFTTKDTLDITKVSEVQNVFKKFRPDYCINCAAYTAVDRAESESELAYEINEIGVQHLANSCSDYNCILIHISTDYVYDSSFDEPIKEDAVCAPRSVYGKSKRAGEVKLLNSDCRWVCFRVSWLYSSYNENFLKTMIKLGRNNTKISVVADQYGCPTYARDLASIILSFIRQENAPHTYSQFYNYCNLGATTWASFAKEIFSQTSIECEVTEITTAEYNAKAPRPLFSILNLDKIERALNIQPAKWQTSLSNCLSEIYMNGKN